MAKIAQTFGILGAALAGSSLILMAQLLAVGLLEKTRLDGVPAIWNTYVTMIFACAGFSFVFSGTIVAPKPHRTIASIALILIGVCIVLAMTCDGADGFARDWLFFCCLLASIVGGFVALTLLRTRAHQPAA